MAVLYKFAVQHLPTNDRPESLDWNFEFAVKCIKQPHVSRSWSADRGLLDVFRHIFNDLYGVRDTDFTSKMINTFQPLLTNADHLRILSRAALYCLQFICDSGITKDEAKRHLGVKGMEKKRRNSSPWKWHRLTSAHKIPKNGKRPVLYFKFRPHKSLNFCQSYAVLPKKTDAYNHGIYSSASFDWKNTEMSLKESPQRWEMYLGYLEYLAEILPLAG